LEELDKEYSETERRRIDERIKFASLFRLEHNRFPTEKELDSHFPLNLAVHAQIKARKSWHSKMSRIKLRQGGLVGVSKYLGRWRARMTDDRGRTAESFHTSALAAAKAYNTMAAKYRKQYAVFCDLDVAEKLDHQEQT
jgi:hypothetical protein